MENIEEFTALAKARSNFYRLLSDLYFKELSEEAIANLKATDLRSLSVDNEEADQGIALMATYLTRARHDARQELACDYARCMLAAGAYEDRRPTPYESVFTSEDGLLMQDARDDVYRFFREAGIGVDESLRTPEDHLSFEFEFMATMSERAAKNAEAGNIEQALNALRIQQDFHERHLANWIDTYTECLETCANTKFYQGLAKLTRGFVAEDTEMLTESAELLAA